MSEYKSDIEIAQETELLPIEEVAAKIGLTRKDLELYGNYKAKLDYTELSKKEDKAKLILVTAITPTPAGEGKTTTVVGLGDALNRIGKKTVIALREPSLGPVFGVKGGAAGGGYAPVSYTHLTIPTDNISDNGTTPEGMIAQIESGNIVFSVSGTQSDVNDISADDVKAYVDLSGYSEGTYENVPVQIVLPDGVMLVSDEPVYVSVTLS